MSRFITKEDEIEIVRKIKKDSAVNLNAFYISHTKPMKKHGTHDQQSHAGGRGSSFRGVPVIGGELHTDEQRIDFENEAAKVPDSHWKALEESGVKIRIMDSPKGAREKVEGAHFDAASNEIRLASDEGGYALIHEVGHALDYNAVDGKNSFMSHDKRMRTLLRESGYPTYDKKTGPTANSWRVEEFAMAYQHYFDARNPFSGFEDAKPTAPLKQLFDNLGNMILAEKPSKG